MTRSGRPRILLTGPSGRFAEYSGAAGGAGWDATELPLIETSPLLPAPDGHGGRYDWIAITSSNALAWLERALAETPALSEVPCGVVGARSAERARALGLRVGLSPAADAAELAEALVAAGPDGARVLWPRGPRSSELGEALLAAGFAVDAPLAYESRSRDPVTLPEAEAVFFASPSAVREFAERYRDCAARTEPMLAVAIGATTFAALLATTELGFRDTISLPEPTPEGLRASLEHVHRDAP